MTHITALREHAEDTPPAASIPFVESPPLPCLMLLHDHDWR